MNPLLVLLAIAVLIFFAWWTKKRPQRSLPEGPDIMKTRAHLVPQLQAAYVKRREELLGILGETLLIETEESLYTDSLVWRRQYEANPNSENKAKCEFHFDNLRQLHSAWELNHPQLKELNERIGNIREALFILEYGSPDDVQKLITSAKAQGWEST